MDSHFKLEQIKPIIPLLEGYGLKAKAAIIDDEARLLLGLRLTGKGDETDVVMQRKYVKDRFRKFYEQMLGTPWILHFDEQEEKINGEAGMVLSVVFKLMPDDDEIWAENSMKKAIERMKAIDEAAF